MSRGGRGRGRGRGSMTFNVEAIGFGRGDALPAPTLQPPPSYPPLRQQPIPLLGGEETEYLLALHKEYVQTMQNSPYYIQAEQARSDVERYSDKYKSSRNTDSTINWKPDWRRLPSELKIAVRKKRPESNKNVTPNLVKRSKADEQEIAKKLEVLEKKENTGGKEEEEEEEELEVEEEEEQAEEENDYLTSYFDNGENYLDEEEDTLDDKDGGIY